MARSIKPLFALRSVDRDHANRWVPLIFPLTFRSPQERRNTLTHSP